MQLGERMKKLLTCIFNTKAIQEMDCTECEHQLVLLAEEVAAGAELAEISPAVDANLLFSPTCRKEFEALVAIIRAEQEGELD